MKNIIVISHERSGTHFLINTIAYNFPEYSNTELSIESGDPEFIQERLSTVGEYPDRIVKSHHYPDIFGDSLQDFHKFYVVRDGRDVIVSCYHHYGKFLVQPTFTGFLRDPNIPPHIPKFYYLPKHKLHRSMPERWRDHVDAWQYQNCHIIKYEDLIYRFDAVVVELSEIFRVPVTIKRIKPTLDNYCVGPRKGIAGDWKNYFSEEDNDFFWSQAGKSMERLGYECRQ